MLPWKFQVYADRSGRSDVQSTIDRLSTRTGERFGALIRHLAVTPRENWERPQAAKLTGFIDLYEIRFNDGDVPCRPTGYFDLLGHSFIIALFVTKNRNGYHPKKPFDIADQRRRQISKNEARAVTLQFHGEDFPPISE